MKTNTRWSSASGSASTASSRWAVAFATGAEPIPALAELGAVDPALGAHVDATPRVAATDGGILEAGDDGEILEDDTDTDDQNQTTF